MQFSKVHFSKVHFSKVQFSKVQFSTKQYKIQYSWIMVTPLTHLSLALRMIGISLPLQLGW